ncbi:MAG: rRNA maturation RNase YbeY [bacterium]|nr:rRNA maturation RNase YbeY [Patescibacteria group bacterium]
MINVNFTPKAGCAFSEKMAMKTVRIAAKFEKKIKGEVEINTVSDKKIKEINRIYRGKDSVTDVLSFAWKEEEGVNEKSLGQIFISCDKIKRQAKEFGVSANEEFVRMLAHGLLHLVGYDHANKKEEKKMFDLQEKIVAETVIK